MTELVYCIMKPFQKLGVRKVGVGKHVWWYREDARKAARAKLWAAPTAVLLLFSLPRRFTAILPGVGGCDVEERWRVAQEAMATYVESVRHTEERVVELVEERLGCPYQLYREQQMRAG